MDGQVFKTGDNETMRARVGWANWLVVLWFKNFDEREEEIESE